FFKNRKIVDENGIDKGDIDLAVWKSKNLIIFECKGLIPPDSDHETRYVDKQLERGLLQLNNIKTVIQENPRRMMEILPELNQNIQDMSVFYILISDFSPGSEKLEENKNLYPILTFPLIRRILEKSKTTSQFYDILEKFNLEVNSTPAGTKDVSFGNINVHYELLAYDQRELNKIQSWLT
ncbi:MAG: hypothetical protein ACTSUE_21320, partial [Promethearchaeota archaeon]